MRSLYQCLVDAKLPRLRAIARFWGIDIEDLTGRERVAALAQAMTDGDTAQRVLQLLPEMERRALTDLQAQGGSSPVRVFDRSWGSVRAMGQARMMRDEPWGKPDSPAEGLWYKGFLFAEFEISPAGSFERIFVPGDLLSLLPPAQPGREELTPEPIQPQESPHGVTGLLLDDVCAILAFVQSGRAGLSRDMGWTDKDLVVLEAQLWDASPDRLRLATALVAGLGLVTHRGPRDVRLAPEPARSWLQLPTAEQREALADEWVKCSRFDELQSVPALTVDEAQTGQRDPRLARRTVLRYLAKCAPAAWYAIADLTAVIKRSEPDFQRPGGDYDSWYVRDLGTGEYLAGFDSWGAVEGRLIHYLLSGPLTWLGLVETDSADPARATAFRLSDEGAIYLGWADVEAPVEPAGVDVRPDFTVRVPAAQRFERFQLARVADWVATGDPFVYRIGPTSLDRAAAQSISVDRVVDFLRDASRGPVPRSVLDTLAQWDTRRSAARISSVSLLRADSEETMAQIVRSPSTRRYIVEQVGSLAAIVRPGAWRKLVEELGRLAILSEVELADR